MRLFVAVELPVEVKAVMAALQAQLATSGVDASWPRPAGLHLTLKFLGETGEDQVPLIERALALAPGDTEEFRLRGEGVGTFPRAASARVVWLGVRGEVERLVALRDAVEGAMTGLGAEPDDRPYAPHLTLGRIRRIPRRDQWLKGLEQVRDARLPEFDVAAVSLMGSELGPGGAVHRELARVALKPRLA